MKMPWRDAMVVGLYYGGVVTCFVLSARSVSFQNGPRPVNSCLSHHILSNHSEEMYRLTNRLDHLGIVFVIYVSTVANTHFVLYLRPQSQHIHLTIVSSQYTFTS